MDIASVLEEYLADIATLPGDLAFILDEIQVNDQKLLEAQRRIQQRDGQIQKYVQSNGAMPECNKEQQFYPKIRSDYQECILLQQEKARLATMGLFLVTKHVTKLDNHITVMEADGVLPPVTQDVEDYLTPPEPIIPKKVLADTSRRVSRPETRTHSRSSSIQPVAKPVAPTPPTPVINTQNSTPQLVNKAEPVPEAPAPAPVVPSVSRIQLKRSLQSPRQPPNEEGDETFCYCKKGSLGNMIACDGDDCDIEWFHWECVGLTEDPKGSWYCSGCKEKLKKR